MFRIDNSTAVSSAPTPGAAGTPGHFTKGDPGSGVPATVLDADWAECIQEELIALLTAAGVTPDKTNRAQVLAAIRALSLGGPAQSYNVVTGSRALSTTYTNSRDCPIFINVYANNSTSGAVMLITVNGTIVIKSAGQNTTGSGIGGFAIIPPRATYSVSVSVGTGTLVIWSELSQ